MSNLKRKIGCESEFNSSDDDDLCAEVDSVEVKYKKSKSEEDYFLCHICVSYMWKKFETQAKSKYSFAISHSDILLSMWKTI